MRIIILSLAVLMYVNSNLTGQDFSKSLKYTFISNNPDSLLSLLYEWNEKIQSNEKEISVDKYGSEIYSIFNEFYTPFNLTRIGSSEWGDSLYLNKFAIIQNQIQYVIAEFPNPDTIVIGLEDDTLTLSKLEKKYGKDSGIFGYYENLKNPIIKNLEKVVLTDFRPETTLPHDKKLYLTAGYESELIQFLGDQHSELGEGGIMNPARATNKTWERQSFLNRHLNVIYGHWGGYWHLETHPEASVIVINPEMTKALIYFRLVYEGGSAYLERQNGEWVLKESKLTWIE